MASSKEKKDVEHLVAAKVSAEINSVGNSLGKSLKDSFIQLEKELCKRVEEQIQTILETSFKTQLADLETKVNNKVEEQAAEIADLKDEVASLKNSYGNLKEEFVYMQRDFEEQLKLREDSVKVSTDLETAIDENEQESKRCSVRITGTSCNIKDTDEQLATKCLKVFNEGEIAMSKSDFKRIRIIGKTAVVDFNSWSARVRANAFNRLNRRKRQKIRVQANLTKRRFGLLQWTQQQIKMRLTNKFGDDLANLQRKDNVFALANMESNLLICVGGKFQPFNSLKEAQVILDNAFESHHTDDEDVD